MKFETVINGRHSTKLETVRNWRDSTKLETVINWRDSAKLETQHEIGDSDKLETQCEIGDTLRNLYKYETGSSPPPSNAQTAYFKICDTNISCTASVEFYVQHVIRISLAFISFKYTQKTPVRSPMTWERGGSNLVLRSVVVH